MTQAFRYSRQEAESNSERLLYVLQREDEEETTGYLLCHYSAHGNLRIRILGHPEFSDKTCLATDDF